MPQPSHTLAEIRCEKCGKLLAKGVNLRGCYECPKCRHRTRK